MNIIKAMLHILSHKHSLRMPVRGSKLNQYFARHAFGLRDEWNFEQGQLCFQGLSGWREKKQKQIYFKTNKQTKK